MNYRKEYLNVDNYVYNIPKNVHLPRKVRDAINTGSPIPMPRKQVPSLLNRYGILSGIAFFVVLDIVLILYVGVFHGSEIFQLILMGLIFIELFASVWFFMSFDEFLEVELSNRYKRRCDQLWDCRCENLSSDEVGILRNCVDVTSRTSVVNLLREVSELRKVLSKYDKKVLHDVRDDIEAQIDCDLDNARLIARTSQQASLMKHPIVQRIVKDPEPLSRKCDDKSEGWVVYQPSDKVEQ